MPLKHLLLLLESRAWQEHLPQVHQGLPLLHHLLFPTPVLYCSPYHQPSSTVFYHSLHHQPACLRFCSVVVAHTPCSEWSPGSIPGTVTSAGANFQELPHLQHWASQNYLSLSGGRPLTSADPSPPSASSRDTSIPSTTSTTAPSGLCQEKNV